MDTFNVGGKQLESRLFIGTGKYGSNEILPKVIESSKTQVITVALRRVDLNSEEDNILNYIKDDCVLLPNTSGARNAEEVIRLVRLSKAAGCGNWIKIEAISDNKYLLPDNYETIKATEILAKEGFCISLHESRFNGC